MTLELPKSRAEAARVSETWLSLDETAKCRFLKQVNEKAPKLLENWMVHAGITGARRPDVAKRTGDFGPRLDALVADVDRAKVWSSFFIDWFKHIKTYLNDFCNKVQRELAMAGCAPEELEGKMLDEVRKRYHDDPFIELFIATVRFHNMEYDPPRPESEPVPEPDTKPAAEQADA